MDFGVLSFLYLLAYLVGAILGLAVGSVFSAVWLRLAAYWLKIGEVGFGTAFRCCILVNLVNMMTQLSIGFSLGLSMRLGSGRRSMEEIFMFNGFSSIYFLYVLVFSLLLMACLLRRFVTDENGLSLSFGDAFSLSAVHFAVSVFFLCLIGGVAFASGMALLESRRFF